jgi:hypothetical protein
MAVGCSTKKPIKRAPDGSSSRNHVLTLYGNLAIPHTDETGKSHQFERPLGLETHPLSPITFVGYHTHRHRALVVSSSSTVQRRQTVSQEDCA